MFGIYSTANLHIFIELSMKEHILVYILKLNC